MSPGVDSLASRALTALVTKAEHGALGLRDDMVEALRSAIHSFDPEVQNKTLAEFAEQKISPEQIIDTYVPAVSHLLGEAWCADAMNFADVTIGAARLQAIVRDLTPHVRADVSSSDLTTSVAVIVREQEDHTLGAVIVANQMRRYGVSVQLILGASDAEIIKNIKDKDFDAVAISASCGERVGKIKSLVQGMRANSKRQIQIALGGSIVEHVENLQAKTTVDLVTVDTSKILELCGLNVSHSRGASCKAGR